jgi:hypothetical protein
MYFLPSFLCFMPFPLYFQVPQMLHFSDIIYIHIYVYIDVFLHILSLYNNSQKIILTSEDLYKNVSPRIVQDVGHLWHMPVVVTTWKGEIRDIFVQVQPGYSFETIP